MDAEKVNERGFMIRIKRKVNPTDQKIIDKLSITKTKLDGSGDYDYILYDGNKVIGGAGYNPISKYITWVQLNTNYRRKGIASFLYKYIENDLDIKIDKPSPFLSKDGEKFWRSRLKK